VLKNSFRGISRTKFARKLLNLRLPQALKFTEITALVPFSTATGNSDNFAGASPFRAHEPGPESALPPSSQAQLPICTLGGGGAVYMSAAIGGKIVVSQMHFSGSTLCTPI